MREAEQGLDGEAGGDADAEAEVDNIEDGGTVQRGADREILRAGDQEPAVR